jgi:hypothetical protein
MCGKAQPFRNEFLLSLAFSRHSLEKAKKKKEAGR